MVLPRQAYTDARSAESCLTRAHPNERQFCVAYRRTIRNIPIRKASMLLERLRQTQWNTSANGVIHAKSHRPNDRKNRDGDLSFTAAVCMTGPLKEKR